MAKYDSWVSSLVKQAMTMEYMTVATVGDLLPGETRLVEVGNCSILLINNEGQFYAVQGLCNHQSLPLEGGQLWQGVLDCPWHHFQYDIRTGENLYPRRVYPIDALPHLLQQVEPLKTYMVRIVDQDVQVEIPAECMHQPNLRT